MKKLVIGILAHVDAGKTTLSESLLYLCGKINKLGRVDHKDAYLDTEDLEKARGITIFSKQAIFQMKEKLVTLMDTPGHVDFSAEMERILSILDYAILVVSGTDGVQSHTQTLWSLLQHYQVPTFLFVNKMDQDGTNQIQLIQQLKEKLSENCVIFSEKLDYEDIACCDETLMEYYLENDCVEKEQVVALIKKRLLFPVFFGSALRVTGVDRFIEGLNHYTEVPNYPQEFGAKVFKIGRDDQGNRLTYLKLTGGTLKVRDSISGQTSEELWEEKITQIRLYSGNKYEAVNEVTPGTVCAVTGLSKTYAGQGLGIEQGDAMTIIQPVLSYQMVLPEGCDPKVMLPKLRQLEEEEPELHIVWDETLQEIQVQIMGEVQIEVLQCLIEERFHIKVEFVSGKIIYKETIANVVEGVGHFEPLRHYAEVHLLLEPAEEGSGLQFGVACSEDILDKNWQRLVLTHLYEKVHKGVLTGSAITDMKITLVTGKAHTKHTEGGDFRQATYRAVRQGLMEAESILLEPYYNFKMEIPDKVVGRAMTDIDKMKGTYEIVKTEDGMTTLRGTAPVATMRYYQNEINSYTKGHGRISYQLKGYAPCHNAEEVIEEIAYDPLRDIENPTDSVFCAHGAGIMVPWYEVKDYMHVESILSPKIELEEIVQKKNNSYEEEAIGTEEIDKIMQQTFYANQGKRGKWNKKAPKIEKVPKPVDWLKTPVPENKPKYLLIDGYNVIYTWKELYELTKENMDSAKTKLLEELSHYQGIHSSKIIVVFDAYKVPNYTGNSAQYQDIQVIYTKEGETADQYIEKFTSTHKNKYDITVATSDGMEQRIVSGQGGKLLSARELKEKIKEAHEQIMQRYQETQIHEPNYLKNYVDLTPSSDEI